MFDSFKIFIVVQRVFLCSIFGFLSVAFQSCTPKMDSSSLEEAQQLLWSDPEHCIEFLDSIHPTLSSSHDHDCWNLWHEHALLRVYRWIESDSLINQLAQSFVEQDDYSHAGEANYLLGTCYLLRNQAPMAVYRLKDAEFYLRQATPIDTNLLGITLYRLGCAFEDENLYDLASTQFEKALPYLIDSNNKLYAASCYRDIAMKNATFTREQRLAYLDTAMCLYKQIPNAEVYQEIVTCRALEQRDTMSQELLDAYKHLCSISVTLNNAQRLVAYYMEQNQLDSCEKYLKVLEQDTCYSEWSKENYLHLCAIYHQKKGNYQKADFFHEACYDIMVTRLYHKILSQTVVISQQYDLTKEKEKTMLAQLARQRERLMLATIVIILSIITIVLLIVYYQYKMRSQQKIQKQASDIVTLTAQNEAKKEALRAKLNSYIQQSQQEHISAQLTKGYSPDELEQIKAEFELIYDNRLYSLQQQFNNLTESDIYVIMLIVLGYDIQDCCILLNMKKTTLWQRRKRIKQHLGLEAEADMDLWLRQQFS